MNMNDFHAFQRFGEQQGTIVAAIVNPKRFETWDEGFICPHHTDLEHSGGMNRVEEMSPIGEHDVFDHAGENFQTLEVPLGQGSS